MTLVITLFIAGCGARIGEECGQTTIQGEVDCAEGECVSGLCRQNEALIGQDCDQINGCKEGFCKRQARNDPTGVCTEYQAEGEPCAFGKQCNHSARLTCFEGTCVGPQPEGAKCKLQSEMCQEGLSCWPDFFKDDSLPRDYDRPGTCLPHGEEGERCDPSMKVYCKEPLSCPALEYRVCEARPR